MRRGRGRRGTYKKKCTKDGGAHFMRPNDREIICQELILRLYSMCRLLLQLLSQSLLVRMVICLVVNAILLDSGVSRGSLGQKTTTTTDTDHERPGKQPVNRFLNAVRRNQLWGLPRLRLWPASGRMQQPIITHGLWVLSPEVRTVNLRYEVRWLSRKPWF